MSGWIAETLVASTLLMLAVLVLRGRASRMFGPRSAYALWLLPALRMMLPPLPGLHHIVVPALVIRLSTATTPAKVAVGLIDPKVVGPDRFALPGLPSADILAAAQAAQATPLTRSLDLRPAAVAVWVIGAVLLLAWQLWRYRRFVAQALGQATLIGTAGRTRILLSDAVGGPVATGVLHRRILLPRDFARRYTRAQQRLVLDHEAAHHDRGDLVANLAALVILAIHWWNPIAWLAHRSFRADQELACDASVLARLAVPERETYARAVACSAGFVTPAAAAPLSPVAELKGRLASMNRPTSGPVRTIAGVMMTGIVLAAGLVASASSGQEAVTAPPAPPMMVAPVAPLAPLPDDVSKPARIVRVAVTPRRAAKLLTPVARDRANVEALAARSQADAVRASAAAAAAAADAQRAVAQMDIPRLIRTSMDAARVGVVAGCRQAGGDPHAGADIRSLASCNADQIAGAMRTGLLEARGEIAADPEVNSREAGPALHSAPRAIDTQLARLSLRSR